MFSNRKLTDRPVLHIADVREKTSAALQSSLSATDHEILLRKDLYRAMGAVAATRRHGSLAAIVISTRVLGSGQEDFFRYLFAGQRNVPVAYYGPKVEGATFAALAACAQPIQPEDVASFLGVDLTEHLPPTQDETRKAPPEPSEPDKSSSPIEDDEFTVETSEFGPLDFSPGFESQLPMEATDESEREFYADDKIAAEEDSVHHHSETEKPAPVPWRPNPHRPARTPPKQTDTIPSDGFSSNPSPEQTNPAGPLLTREELDALLDDGQDDAQGGHPST